MNAIPENIAHRFRVDGVHCAGCVSSLEKALNSVSGVTRVSVNLATNIADVAGATEINDLFEAVSRAGFEPVADTAMQDDAAHAARHGREDLVTLASFVLTAPLRAPGLPNLLEFVNGFTRLWGHETFGGQANKPQNTFEA